MNALKLGKTLLVAVVSMLFVATVRADANLNYAEEYSYRERLMQCVDKLRPIFQPLASDRVIYNVEEIELRGPWYRFEISTTIVAEDGTSVLDDYKVGCKANRWIDSTRLLSRRNADQPVLDSLVIARNL